MAMKKKEIAFLEEIKRHNRVLWEDMRSQVKIVAEQYGSIVGRFNNVDLRLDNIDIRLNKVELKLQEHDGRFDVIDIDLKAIKGTLFDTSHKIDGYGTRIRRLEAPS